MFQFLQTDPELKDNFHAKIENLANYVITHST